MEGLLTQLAEFLEETGNTERWVLIPGNGYVQRTFVMKEQLQMLLRGNDGREVITKEDMTDPVCGTRLHLIEYSNHREKDVTTLEAALNQREKDAAMLVIALENSSLSAKLKRFIKSVFLRR